MRLALLIRKTQFKHTIIIYGQHIYGQKNPTSDFSVSERTDIARALAFPLSTIWRSFLSYLCMLKPPFYRIRILMW